MKSNQKKQSKSKSHIPLRLNVLFAGVFVCFALLILRLGYLQIVKGEELEAEVDRTETTLATGNVARGEIFDADHENLVGNTPVQTITYTRGKGVSSENMANIARDLAGLIHMPHVVREEVAEGEDSDITFRDLQDYWLVVHEDEVNKRLTKKELEQSGSKFYQLQLSKITEKDISQMTDLDKEAATIFKEMNGAFALTTINIKNEDVTDQEIALVSENMAHLPGIDTGTDWVRNYPQGGMLKSILGGVTSEEQGVPESRLSAYLAHGYARNDRVGNSYLEQQYESVLRGSKSKAETQTNNNGDIIDKIEQYAGEKGDNLVLTMDMDFQKQVEQIAEEALEDREGYSDRIYITAVNPQNGEILALAGKKYNSETGKIEDDSLGTINQAFTMGSSVKGATVLAGYMDGALTFDDNVMVDAPLKTGPGVNERISSVFNRSGSVPVDDITALERSSNVYMAKVVLRMGGQYNLRPDNSFSINPNSLIDKLRQYFAQFGLGVKTGIDLPGETTGYDGVIANAAQPMFYGFGQFDTYTPIQLLQYASTIANGGTRFALRLVDEIWSTGKDGELGQIETQLEPEILNTVNVDPKAMERVQQGFYQVVNGTYGSARGRFVGAEYVSAGKTGTAEAFYDNPETPKIENAEVTNKTYVGYAPHDNPQIAVSVVVPYLPTSNSNYQNTISARKVMDAYFKVGAYKEATEEPVETEEPPAVDQQLQNEE